MKLDPKEVKQRVKKALEKIFKYKKQRKRPQFALQPYRNNSPFLRG
jgi:hypothetical protein